MEEVLFVREKDFKNKEDALDYIASELHFPSYFGRNLDALYDCLIDMDKTVNIALYPRPSDDSHKWYRKICEVIIDAAGENENIMLLSKLG